MKLVAYLRVSSQGQADADRYGLDGQKAQVEAWARANGHSIVAVYQDVETGTADAEIRRGLGDVLNAVANKLAEGVVAASQSRWARDAILAETLYRRFWDLGSRVFTAEEGELEPDSGDPTRVFIRRIMSAFAEYEKAQLVARMARGREQRVLSGLPINGHYPYGWGEDGAIPDEQAVLARIIGYREQGMSYAKIASALNHDGVSPRRATRWHAQVVLDIYKRERERRDGIGGGFSDIALGVTDSNSDGDSDDQDSPAA